MDEYQVIITPDAEKDLMELDDYITFELLVPEIAVAYIAAIKQELLTLKTAPKRYRVIDDEPWKSRGVRRMNVKNFAALPFISSRSLCSIQVISCRNDQIP